MKTVCENVKNSSSYCTKQVIHTLLSLHFSSVLAKIGPKKVIAVNKADNFISWQRSKTLGSSWLPDGLWDIATLTCPPGRFCAARASVQTDESFQGRAQISLYSCLVAIRWESDWYCQGLIGSLPAVWEHPDSRPWCEQTLCKCADDCKVLLRRLPLLILCRPSCAVSPHFTKLYQGLVKKKGQRWLRKKSQIEL